MQATIDTIWDDELGTGVLNDTPAGVTTLTVVDAIDFDEDGGWLSLNGQVLEYASGDEEAPGIITLVDPLPADATAGDTIRVLNADDTPAFNRYCTVTVGINDAVETPENTLEDDPEPGSVDALVRTSDLPLFPPGIDLAGVQVEIDSDGTDWVVITRPAHGGVIDLSMADPTTVPEPVPVSPPVSTPTLSVRADAEGLWAMTAGTLAPSTTLDFFLDDTLVGTARAALYVTAADHGLQPDVDYRLTVQARNVAGVAAMSEPVVARLDPGVTAELVMARIRAGLLDGDVITAGGDTIRLDSDGLQIQQDDGTVSKLARSGSFLAGEATLNAVQVLDRFVMRGLGNNLLGLLTLGNGVPDPSEAPTVTPAWASLPTQADPDYGTWSGLAAGAQPGDFATSQALFGGTITLITAAGALYPVQLPSKWNPLGGVARAGSYLCVLGRDDNRGGRWFVRRYTASDATYVGEWEFTATSGGKMPAIGSVEGKTDRVLIARTLGSGNTYVWTLDVVTGNVISGPTQLVSLNEDLTAIYYGTYGFSAPRWVIASESRIRVLSDASTQVAEGWASAARSRVRGLAFSGGTWHSWDGRTVWHYTTHPGGWLDVALTDVDNDSGGAGTAETRPGPRRSINSTRFAQLRIQVAPPDDAGGVDDPNSRAIYVGAKGGTITREALLTTSPWSITLDRLAGGGSPPPSTSGFAGRPTTARGVLASTAVGADGKPLWSLGGDGAARLSRLIQADRVTITPTAANTLTNVWVTFPEPFAAAPVGNATARTNAGVTCETRAYGETTEGMYVSLRRPDTNATLVNWNAVARS